MKYVVTMNGKRYEVEVERMSAFHMLTREEIASGVSTPVQPVAAPAPKAAAPAPAAAAPAPAAAAPAPAASPAPAAAVAPAAKAAPGGTSVTSPMPGAVLGVKVNVGDKVSAGQTMFVLEAMKMENEIVAPVDGTVASINVKTGDTVDTDQVMGTLN
ncbi:biotin/lipoyl-containing protein [Stomatobaculum longum]|uniref:biotin/lipoyl-containing protein n=1 Tax=Stomatobaculum longum TaxID=796942 RepID=UPI0028E28DDD|nr:biotin/lipoyl-containing protein [Stomatobaculum longum]